MLVRFAHRKMIFIDWVGRERGIDLHIIYLCRLGREGKWNWFWWWGRDDIREQPMTYSIQVESIWDCFFLWFCCSDFFFCSFCSFPVGHFKDCSYFITLYNLLCICLFICSHFDSIRSLYFHPTESALITASEDHSLKLWNLQKTVPQKK